MMPKPPPKLLPPVKDAGKAAVERAVFRDFALRWRADIDVASIRSGEPLSREPDIVAKSSESDTPVAAELVRLTEEESQALVRRALGGPAPVAPAAAPPLAIDAFSRKFAKAQQGLYAGAHAHDLELLAWSDHLATPWDIVLLACERFLEHPAQAQGFSSVWLWRRPAMPGGAEEGLWVWTPGKALSRFG